MIFFPVLFAAYAVFLIATAVLTASGEFQSWLAHRLAARVGLGVPVDLEAALCERVRLRALARSLGGLVGLAVGFSAAFWAIQAGVLPALTTVEHGYSTSAVMAIYGITALSAVGTGLGAAWATLRVEAARSDGPRVARSRAVEVSDFLPPILRFGAWPQLALACATVAVVVIATGLTPRVIPAIAVAAIGCAGLLVFEVVVRRVVSRGRPASGTDQLVWDDALRSEALREVLYPPLWCVTFGAWWSLSGPGGQFAAPLALIPATLGLVALVGYAYVFRRTRTYYLQRLWPGARRRTPDEEEARITAQVHAS